LISAAGATQEGTVVPDLVVILGWSGEDHGQHEEPEQDAGETSAKEKDLREEHRKRVIKSATIILGPAKSETSCIIRNQNAGGAELEVPADVIAPGKFLLYVPIDGVAYRAEIRWRKKNRLGVGFTWTEPEPQFHYG
jgi:hypothetical protein